MNEIEKIRLQQFKYLLSSAGFAVILLLILMMVGDSGRRDWEHHQELYLDVRTEKESLAGDLQIRQITKSDLNLTDRCPTCHIGLFDKHMHDQPQPLTAHPGNWFSLHDPEDFGCTTCHGGRGRALDLKQAHDATINNPFLLSGQTQAYCGKCHLTIFPSELKLPGAERLTAGRTVFFQHGCQGCHKIRGAGGMHGPDLTDLGTRTLNSFDFRHVDGPVTIDNWHREHLRKPQTISAGSVMPAYDLPEAQMEDLILFLRGQFSPHYPIKYIGLPMIREFKGERPEIDRSLIFSRLCSGCHAQNGSPEKARSVPFPVPHLANPDFQAAASLDFIAFTLAEGRGGRPMHGWTAEFSGLNENEIRALITIVRRMRSAGPALSVIKRRTGRWDSGPVVYRDNCAMCHEADAGIRVAPNIRSQGFLALATDDFILKNIIHGRANTAMPAWRTLTPDQLAGLLAYIRSGQTAGSSLPVTITFNGSVSRGDSLFYYNCSRCHGEQGDGGIGPAILNPDFLHLTDPGFVARTLTYGRAHSAMFGLGGRGTGKTADQYTDITDLVTYLFSRRDSIPDYIPTGMILGDPEKGRSLYYRRCAECHGQHGEGGKGPALNNQEFLSAASNGYILATISLGRRGTKMPSWGRGDPDFPALTPQERLDLVARVRQWQTIRIKRDRKWVVNID